MQKHHVVQDKYLAQWSIDGTKNHLNLFIISENKCKTGNTKSKLFWRKDFNVLDDEGDKSYLPEQVTSIIDTKGIEAIKRIDTNKRNMLSAEDRSAIAFYVALQYIRVPKHRDETDKFIGATLKYLYQKDVSSPDKIKISKEELLNHKPVNDVEKEAMQKISQMSDEEIKNQLFEFIQGGKFGMKLTNTGHSKSILKVDRIAEELFNRSWLFLIAPKGSSFITSDSPCFTISTAKLNGLLSPFSNIIFPLRPDLCISIKPSIKSHVELYDEPDSEKVDMINKLILANSYECVVDKDKEKLESLVKNFDTKSHVKSRDTKITESGSYTLFNME